MLRIPLLALVLTISAVAVQADSFTVTQGSVIVPGFAFTPTFQTNIAGPGISFSGTILRPGASIGPNICEGGCAQGSFVSLNSSTGIFGFPNTIGGSLTINGQNYIGIESEIRGSLSMGAGSLMIPFTNDPTISLVAPFTLSASFSSLPVIFDTVTINGSGLAVLLMDRLPDERYRFRSITYTLSTPEPASILLICFGVVGLAVRLQRSGRT